MENNFGETMNAIGEENNFSKINNKDFDRRIVSIDDLEDIEYFNCHIAIDSDRCIISKSNDFSVINMLLEEDGAIFDKPKTILNYGGKTYYPGNNRK